MRAKSPSDLRQALRGKIAELDDILEPFFDRAPIFPAFLRAHDRVCGKPGCRCTQGHLHPGKRVVIPFRDGSRTLTVRPEDVEGWKSLTDAYQRLRMARRSFRAWQKELNVLFDAIEKARRSTEGIPAADLDRPMRGD